MVFIPLDFTVALEQCEALPAIGAESIPSLAFHKPCGSLNMSTSSVYNKQEKIVTFLRDRE
jgi:hypothetical protein